MAKLLKDEYPAGTELYFITGLDTMEAVVNWPQRNPKEYLRALFEGIRFVVTPRGTLRERKKLNARIEARLEEADVKDLAHSHTNEMPIDKGRGEDSALEVRELIRRGRNARAYVPKAVFDYMKENELYSDKWTFAQILPQENATMEQLIAAHILEKLPPVNGLPRLIGAMGPRGAGGTTEAEALAGLLRKQGYRVLTIPTHHFFKPKSERVLDNIKKIMKFSGYNPKSVYMDEFVDFVEDLKAGRSVDMPIYDFAPHRRVRHRKVNPLRYDYIILEGLVTWTIPALRSLFDLKIFMKVDKKLQLKRLLDRDIKKYGYTEKGIRLYHRVLAREYQKFLKDKVKFADILIEDNRIYWVNERLQADFEEQMKAKASEVEDKETREKIKAIQQAPDERWDTLIQLMDKSDDKMRIIEDIKEIERQRGVVDVLEIGCGGGAILAGILQHIRGIRRLAGTDYNGYLVSRVKGRFSDYPQVEFYVRDACHWYDRERFKAKFDVVILGSVFHEIVSFYGMEKAEEVIRLCRYFLKAGGIIIVRDGLKPANGRVIFKAKTDFGRGQLVKFTRDFQQRKINAFHPLTKERIKNLEAYFYEYGKGAEVEMSRADFYELLIKYIYTKSYSWKDEMEEGFGVVTEAQYRNIFSKYFKIIKFRTYKLPYLLNERWIKDFEVTYGDYPDSHVYLIAKNPPLRRRRAAAGLPCPSPERWRI